MVFQIPSDITPTLPCRASDRGTSHRRAYSYAYAYAGASSIPLKYGDFTAVLAREGSRSFRAVRESLTLHIFIALTVKANHPPYEIEHAIACGGGQVDQLPMFLIFQCTEDGTVGLALFGALTLVVFLLSAHYRHFYLDIPSTIIHRKWH